MHSWAPGARLLSVSNRGFLSAAFHSDLRQLESIQGFQNSCDKEAILLTLYPAALLPHGI